MTFMIDFLQIGDGGEVRLARTVAETSELSDGGRERVNIYSIKQAQTYDIHLSDRVNEDDGEDGYR